MAAVIWTDPALNALDEIADHIALDNYDAACRLVRRIFDKVELLGENPCMGNRPVRLRSTPYRRLVVTPVCVYYRIEGESIVIVFVDRTERNFQISRFTG